MYSSEARTFMQDSFREELHLLCRLCHNPHILPHVLHAPASSLLISQVNGRLSMHGFSQGLCD